jgi:hypothetical protein
MARSIIFFLLLFIGAIACHSQNKVIRVEYFMDIDPGFGLAKELSFIEGDSILIDTVIDISNLTMGYHKLYIRAKDSIGQWSLVTEKLIYKEVISSMGTGPIMRAEYYIDNDPGAGSGVVLPIASGDSINLNLNVDITNLKEGYHKLYIRAKDSIGQWSLVTEKLIYKEVISSMGTGPIVRAEYYIDNDPGTGNGIILPIASGDSINLNLNVDITNLKEGYHKLYIRAKDSLGQWGVVMEKLIYKEGSINIATGSIVMAEYYIDNDPGAGNGVMLSITTGDSISLNLNVDITSLKEGYHKLYIRVKDSIGQWSVIFDKLIYKEAVTNIATRPIVKAEYYIDNDPGLGNAINIPVAQSDSIMVNLNTSISSLSYGYHTVHARVKDSIGQWSTAIDTLIFVSQQSQITNLEYFINTDPGPGLATPIPISPSDSIDIVFSPNLAGLPQGLHRLFVRAKDNNELWTFAVKKEFYYYSGAITELEYFWNTDPGIGNGIDVPITQDSVVDVTFTPITTGLIPGANVLYVRARNQGSNMWSFPQQSVIYFLPNVQQNAAKLEYFVDTDPGLGNGISVPISNDSMVDVTFHLNTQNLGTGLHRLFVRVQDRQGFWGLPSVHSFIVVNDGTNDIAKVEYYIDNDPGLDNGINVPIVGGGPDHDLTFSPSLTALSLGIHTLYVRSKAMNGFWSQTQDQPFMVVPNDNPNITSLESYFDIDPGYGNGTPISITANDTIDITAPISLSGLTVGTHKLHVRSKDANGNWSHIFRKDVNVTTTDNLYPTIAVTPAVKTINAINCAAAVIDSFTVTNTGTNPLNVNITESASWMSISPVAMGIPAGQSRVLYVTASPASALPAQSSANITFTTNDPVNPTLTRPVVFNLPVASYYMTLSDDTLNIDPVQVNRTDSTTLTLTNLSCSSIDIDTIIHSNPRFSHNGLGENVTTTLTGYTYLGFYNGHSYFKSNATTNITQAESSITTLMNQQGLVGYLASINNNDENNWLASQFTDQQAWIGLRDSDGSGTTFPCESATSGNQQLYCWKWPDQTTLESNNFSSWYPGEPNNASGVEDHVVLFSNSHPTVIARGKWNDGNGASSIIHILEVAGGFPLNSLKNLTVYFNSPNIGTFTDTMIIISNAGSDTVIVNAKAEGVPVISIETDSINLAFAGCANDTTLTTLIFNTGNGPMNASILSTALPSWLSVAIDTNKIAATDSASLMITLNNPPLTSGSYNYSILLQSNDTITPIDTIKLHINIPGDSSLTMQYASVVFDTIPRNTSTTFITNLINDGCTPIFVSSTSFGSTAFAENVSTIYLPPYSSYPMVLRFQPSLAGDYFDTLTVVSNVGVQRYPVRGHARGALTYELSKLASNVTIQSCGAMTMDSFILTNIGDAAGTWSIAPTPTLPSWLQVSTAPSPLGAGVGSGGAGTLLPGDSVIIRLGYNATSLINNTYTHTLRVNLSDPQTPYINLPISMQVMGSTNTTFSQDSLDFGLTYYTALEQDTITLTNTGCDTLHITNVLRENEFGIDSTVFRILPGQSNDVILTFLPGANGLYQDTITFIGLEDTLYYHIKGQGVDYPHFTKALKDSIVITMPAPIDLATLNTNNWVIWGEQSGKRTGSYSVNGNDIIFIPTQNFFAGEEVNTSLTQNIKFINGENIQKYSLKKYTEVFNSTLANFKIKPTSVVCYFLPTLIKMILLI